MEKELLLAIRDILKQELEPLKTEMAGMKTEMTNIRNKVDETSEIVKALAHSSQVNKAELEKLQNDIAHIKGNIEAIKKDIYRIEEATANNWADIARLKQAK